VCGLSDVAGHQPLPVVGVIPWHPDGSVKREDVYEGVDKLRSYVAQAWLPRGATTIAVTCPTASEGKPFTAFALANSLAGSGYRTLLVDFDLREPAIHALAGVPNELGVCELLRGETDFRESIVRLNNGLHLLPAGRWSEDARSAAVGGRLEALLQRLKEPFDCVVLHSHALLTAAETVEVARRCQAVLVCTMYRETRVPLAKRAAERVAMLEVPHAGVVYLGATRQEALC
jgi:polysaccharide biosynthesis transport protein